jgi:hypothetical protein
MRNRFGSIARAPHVRALIDAIDTGDDAVIEAAVLTLSRSRRWLAPLALTVSAAVMLFNGLKLTISNWKLMALMVLPASWLWIAMYDLKAHALNGRSFHFLHGPLLWLTFLIVMAITVVAYEMNAVVVFSVAGEGSIDIDRGRRTARRARGWLFAASLPLGVLLAFAALVAARWRPPWFGLLLGVAVGLMMFGYLAGPSRILGIRPTMSRRDKLIASIVTGAVSAALTLPGYLLGRAGILVMGVHPLFVPGLMILIVAVTIHAGANGAVKAVKMSSLLIAGQPTGAPSAEAD